MALPSQLPQKIQKGLGQISVHSRVVHSRVEAREGTNEPQGLCGNNIYLSWGRKFIFSSFLFKAFKVDYLKEV